MNNTVEWANKYIDDFTKNCEYDPLSALEGTESKEQKLYSECVHFLHELEVLTENFREKRNNIVFGKRG